MIRKLIMLFMMGIILTVASPAIAEQPGKFQLNVNPVTGRVFKIDTQTGQVYLYKTTEEILAEVKYLQEEEEKTTDVKEKQKWRTMILEEAKGSAHGYFVPVITRK